MSQNAKDRKLKGKMYEVVEEDEDLVILPDVDNSELIAQFKLSLVGRLFNRERRSLDALIALLPRANIWDVEGRVRGLDLGNHRFQFDFDSEEDLLKVLNKRPCHFSKWSVSLERWAPHIGLDFPNTITFWVQVEGIPTHYWLDAIFKTLGSRLGEVGLIEANKAKFQVEINGDLPLKFALRAQLPSGDIVPVTVKYINLHRYCRTCFLISHEEETCPLLTEQQRLEKRREKADMDGSQDQAPLKREVNSGQTITTNRGFNDVGASGSIHVPTNHSRELSARLEFRDQRNHRSSHNAGTSREVPNRERGNVWKRMEPRGDHHHEQRSDHHSDSWNMPLSRIRDRIHDSKSEAERKKIYEASHADSKRRDSLRREKTRVHPRKDTLIAKNQTSVRVPGLRVESDSHRTASDQNSDIAKQSEALLNHNRDRPFRLVLQKKDSVLSSVDKHAKGGESSDATSSAKKCLRFDDDPPLTRVDNGFIAPAIPTPVRIKANWYDQTVEEEKEAAAAMDIDQGRGVVDVLDAETVAAEVNTLSANLEADTYIGEISIPIVADNPENLERVINDDEEDWYRKEDNVEEGNEDNVLLDDEMLDNDDLLGEDLLLAEVNEEIGRQFSCPILSPPRSSSAAIPVGETLQTRTGPSSSARSNLKSSRHEQSPAKIAKQQKKKIAKSPIFKGSTSSKLIRVVGRSSPKVKIRGAGQVSNQPSSSDPAVGKKKVATSKESVKPKSIQTKGGSVKPPKIPG